MGAAETPHFRGRSGLTVNQLREKHAIQTQQQMVRSGLIYDEILTKIKERNFKTEIIDIVSNLQGQLKDTKSLLFPDIPQALTGDIAKRLESYKLRLLVVPVIPFETPRDVAAALITSTPLAAPVPLAEMYGNYLPAVLNGAAPINETGHYAYIDEPGSRTALTSLLGIENLDEMDPATLAQTIRINGKAALDQLGIHSGAYIGVMTLEEAELSRAVGNPVYGSTSTANHTPTGETNGHFVVAKDGLSIIQPNETFTSKRRPRLVVRFGKHNSTPEYWIPPLRMVSPAVSEEIAAKRGAQV